ncbi:hypothetical protein [Amycolatopsis sp. NPDC059657]|uniref:hypothetical protein n=1 Tax=Amycolatopsis sp. NPDC059657 TaxID=3346899 RepID=UPI00366F576E
MTTPKTEDVRKAVNTAVDQFRTSLLAALGAGNLASKAVVDAVGKAKEKAAENRETVKKNIEELPTEVQQLREKVSPAELRKVIDEYTEAALKLYNKLAESGEQAWDKLVEQPQVKKAIEQLEEALQTAQGRVEDVTTEARERVEDVIAKVTGRPREEKTVEAAPATETKSDEAATTGPAKSTAKTAPRSASTTRRTTTPATAAKKPAAAKDEK